MVVSDAEVLGDDDDVLLLRWGLLAILHYPRLDCPANAKNGSENIMKRRKLRMPSMCLAKHFVHGFASFAAPCLWLYPANVYRIFLNPRLHSNP